MHNVQLGFSAVALYRPVFDSGRPTQHKQWYSLGLLVVRCAAECRVGGDNSI